MNDSLMQETISGYTCTCDFHFTKFKSFSTIILAAIIIIIIDLGTFTENAACVCTNILPNWYCTE